MLQNRIFRIVLLCLISTPNNSEQGQQQQQQGQGRRNNVPQTRQLPGGAHEPRLIAERAQKSKDILKFMNLTADACSDFYEYACGNWIKYQNTDLSRDGELISVQTQMEASVNKQLQDILNEPINSQDTMGTKIIKDFYRSCVRESASSPNQRQFIRSFVSHNGGLPDSTEFQWQPNYNWIQIIAELRNKYGLDILIGLTIDKSPNNKANTIYIEEPQTTLLPAELCSSLATQDIDEKDQVFDKIQEEIKDNLKNWLKFSESDALRIAGGIIRFEFDLCKHMRKHHTMMDMNEELQDAESVNRRSGHSARLVENKMHGVRQNSVNSLKSLTKLSELYEIDFKYFVDHSLGTSIISQVYFRSDDYFQQLSIISKKGLQAAFANYIMYRALVEINFPTNERRQQRPYYCVDKVMHYFPQLLGTLYSDKFSRHEARVDLTEMFQSIKQAFAKNLDTNVEWMMENTKRIIKHKLNIIKLYHPSYPQNIGLIRGLQLHDNQDYWQKLESIMIYSANQTIQQLQWSTIHSNYLEAPAVSIQQKPFLNELVAGFGLLQKPFYAFTFSNSLKFSSIGVAIAREIVKILDDQGWHENPMSTFPWDSSTLESSFNNTECFRSQVSNYFHNNPETFRNASKLRDIMVETSAVSIAFNAYLNWLDQRNRAREELELETLTDLDFTNTQLFFINFAQTHCAARYNEELPPEFFPLSRHTMERFDINGPLSNNMEFGRDFGCQIGSDMNLHDKCLAF